jgi:hypothetical protein
MRTGMCFLSQPTAEPVSRVGIPNVQGRCPCKQQTRDLRFVRGMGVSMQQLSLWLS